MRVELFDTKSSRVLWSKDQKLVDEFVPPLGAQESKSFDFTSDSPATGSSEFRVYLDGTLYKSYPIKSKHSDNDTQTSRASANDEPRTILIPPRNYNERSTPPPVAPEHARAPVSEQPAPAPAPAIQPQTQTPTQSERPPHAPSAEEQTMKDLEQ
jgi:hypothetical protein